MYWYSLYETKTEPKENCWQAGEPKESSYACDSVGVSYLPNGPHMHEVSEQGVGEDFQISPSGDYCNYYRLGEGLNTTNANKQSGYTGYEPPSPLSSYQEGNSHISPPNVCQAYEYIWGHVLQGSGNSNCTTRPPCGMQHYVSLHEQGGNDRPWSSSFGEPSLVISADVLPFTLGTHGGAWGYLCPLFEDQTTGDILEYCFEQWRVGSGFPSTNEHFDVVSACASGGNPAHVIDQTITQFAPGTLFAENVGSEKTFVFESNSTWRDFSARITRVNLENAINRDNTLKNEYEGYNHGGCSIPEHPRGLSTNPANYALIGIEHGMEGGGISELGASEANLQLWTEYTPLPPTVTTESATGISEAQASLHGTVNPNATDTHYHFQYGETTSYGSVTPEIDEGSGTGAIPVASIVSSLQPRTTYNYRIVASNSAGTSYGEDRAFTTLTGKPSVETKPATSIGSTGATLNGTVNPRGAETKYSFEYGTTTSYGSKTAEASAGSGITTLEESKAITGLAASTTYHFRIVATNSNGTTDGSDRVFSTTGKPSVETKPATNIGVTGATLNGTVNPRGTETKYYFEYGLTTSYGSRTAEASAGSGITTLEESKAITGLTANTPYHYRIVATNGYGTTNGTDHTFTTYIAMAPSTSPSVVFNEETGFARVFYQNTNGAIAYWEWSSGTGWVNNVLGGTVGAKTSPAAEYNPSTGFTRVFYQNTANGIAYWEWSSGTGWVNKVLGGKAAAKTSPAVEYNLNTGVQTIFFEGSSGAVEVWQWNGSSWITGGLGTGVNVAEGTSPAVGFNPSNGYAKVFYQDTAKEIAVWEWSGSWVNKALGGKAAANTSPAVEYNVENGVVTAYFEGTSGAVEVWQWNGSGWITGGLGTGVNVAEGTSPAVGFNPSNGYAKVFYQDTAKEIALWEWSGSWVNKVLGGKAAANTSPAVEYNVKTGVQTAYFEGTSGAVEVWQWNGTSWITGPL